MDPTIIEVLKYLIVRGMPLKPTLLYIIIASSSSISYLIPNATKKFIVPFKISIVTKTIFFTFFIVGFIFTSLVIPLVIEIISTPFFKQWQQGQGSLRKIVSFRLNFVIEINIFGIGKGFVPSTF